MKIKNSTISLNGLEFKSKIGLFDFEKERGNTFIVNISIDVDKITYDDSIEGTVDYSNLFSIIDFLKFIIFCFKSSFWAF